MPADSQTRQARRKTTADTAPMSPNMVNDGRTCANAACVHAASQNVGRWVGKNRHVSVRGPSPGHFPTAAHMLAMLLSKNQAHKTAQHEK